MQFTVLGEHCPITGNLVTARVVDGFVAAVNGNTIVYAECTSRAQAGIIASALRQSVTNRKAIKARKGGK